MTSKKYYLKINKKDNVEIVIKSLLGYPVNITYNGKDKYWMALPSPRSKIIEELFLSPSLKKLMWRLPSSTIQVKVNKQHGLVTGIDEYCKILENLQNESTKAYYITSAIEYKGEFWLGTNKSTFKI